MNRKFTLIELLIVVAIIGILVSILMPSLGKARKAARKAVCLSNNRQLSVASNLFTKDNKGYFVPNRGGSDFEPAGKNGTDSYFNTSFRNISNRLLNQYLGGPFTDGDEVPITHCPEDNNTAVQGHSFSGSSYPFNIGTPMGSKGQATMTWGTGANKSNLVDAVESPSRFLIISEMGMRTYSKGNGNANKLHYFHTEYGDSRWVAAFADGHTAFINAQYRRKVAEDYTYLIDR